MRLIDADEFRRRIDHYPPEIRNIAKKELRYTSTIEERKTGQWIYHPEWKRDGECAYECDQCGRCYDYKMNFCGYCGTMMEVENE